MQRQSGGALTIRVLGGDRPSLGRTSPSRLQRSRGRNIAAALVVGGQSFSNPSVVVMVVVVAIVSLLILLPMSRLLARKG
jgi:hypothetical protein